MPLGFGAGLLSDALRDIGIPASLAVAVVAATVLIGWLATLSESVRTLVVNVGRALRVVRAAPPFGGDGADARRRRGQRQMYAGYVEGRIAQLNRLEQWADHRYAELEAEVETESERNVGLGLRRLPRMRTQLRRVRSLTRALRTAREQVVLLQGDPGAGKSVALRHLARELAREASHSRRIDCPIPLYVNLKGLRRRDQPIDAMLIEAYVKRELRADANVDIDRFLDAEFEVGVREGTWIFLFDSFDEIPEILAEHDSGPAIRAYSSAVHEFLTGMRTCRGIVASRQFRAPRQTGWPIWTLLPLSPQRKRELVRRAQLSPAQEALVLEQLKPPDTTLGPLDANPLFLGLLCEYVRERDVAPPTVHAVFEQYFDFRMGHDAARLAERFALEPAALRIATEWIAYAMVVSSGTGLTPTRAEVKAELARVGAPLEIPAERVMDALEYLKLARGERDDGSTDDEARFTFAHRRFQEYFATCLLLRDRGLVSARELLLNARWRETAVTLLQTQEAPADELLATATQLLDTAADEVRAWQRARSRLHQPAQRTAFPWPDDSLHLLGLLQAGLTTDDARLPARLVASSSAILDAAASEGLVYDRKWAVESCGTADGETTTRLMLAAFRTPNDWVRDAAGKQVARLSHIDADVRRELQRMLLRLLGQHRLSDEQLTTRAQLARLRPAEDLLRMFRLLRVVMAVDAGANLAVGWYLLHLSPDSLWDVVLIFGLLIASLSLFDAVALWLANRTGPSLLELADAGVVPHAERRRAKWGIPTQTYQDSASWLLLARAAAVLYAFHFMSPNLTNCLVAGVLLPFALTWGPATLLNIESGSAARRRTWPVPQATVVRSAARLASALKQWPAVVVGGVGAVATVAFTALLAGWINDALNWMERQAQTLLDQVEWLRYGILAICGVLLLAMLVALVVAFIRFSGEVHETQQDAVWDRRLSTQQPATLEPAELLAAIDAQQTSSGAARVLANVRSRQLLIASALTRDLLLDLLAVAELGELDAAAWRTDLAASWYEAGGAERIDGMGEQDGAAFVDDLGKLLEDLSSVPA
jgi:hypothetical protein